MKPTTIQIKTVRRLLDAAIKLLSPPPALSVWAWGELRRRMGRNVTAKPGRYSVAATPYMREPQESFHDPTVQTTVLYMAKRLGKTEGAMNLIGSTMEQTPRNILVAYPTLDSAKKFSKQFLDPMIKTTPVLRAMIKERRAKDANNTILSKEFPGGTISAIGANSPSAFRQVQAPVVICDEIDAMENCSEGDPVTLAFGRAENYPDSVQVVSSTATIKQTSRIEAWYEKSDKQKFFVPCFNCAEMHVLAWSQIKWPKFPDGAHDVEAAFYECPKCLAHWNDEQRVAAIMSNHESNPPVAGKRAEWRATARFSGIRGYWLNGINTTFSPKKGFKNKLHQFAAEFLEAYTSGEAARISWKNTFLCEAHEEIAERVEAAPLLERCEDYTPDALPLSCVVIGAAVDVQGDRLEYEIVAMGEGEETWGVRYGKIYGDPEKDEAWADMKAVIQEKFKRKDGVEIPISAAVFDLGHKPHRVRKFIKTCGLPMLMPGRPGVGGVYGSGTGKQHALVVPRQNKHYRMFSYSLNTTGGKDVIFARLRLKDAGARYMHWPKGFGYDEAYFNGLTAEEVRIKYSHGFPERYYEKIRPRNEPLDIRVYFLGAMDVLKPNIAMIEKNLKRDGEAKDYVLKQSAEKPAEQPAPPAPRQDRQPFVPHRPGGWIGGWK